jgi:hypothetical protein
MVDAAIFVKSPDKVNVEIIELARFFIILTAELTAVVDDKRPKTFLPTFASPEIEDCEEISTAVRDLDFLTCPIAKEVEDTTDEAKVLILLNPAARIDDADETDPSIFLVPFKFTDGTDADEVTEPSTSLVRFKFV